MKQWFRVFLVSTLVVLLTACGGGGGGTGSNDNNNDGSGTTTDTIAPVITLNGEATLTLNVGDIYTEAGATATDNVDGTVTVVTTGSVDTAAVGTYTVTYTATDVAGNEGTNTRTVTVSAVVVPDTTAPVITLNGEATLTLNVGDIYTEAGATATDNVDGTVAVTTSGSVDTSLAGTYTITYMSTDKAGNKGTNIRTVTVGAATVASSKLKKTGQTVSYYASDDGDYQVGITPSYTRDDSKEVVTDNVTGLMWQDNPDVASVKKPWIVVLSKPYDTSGNTATTYCTDLTLGGYDDWRLPTIEELDGIVDYGRVPPAIDSEFVNTAFESNVYYWSSTSSKQEYYQSYAWMVKYNDGRNIYGDKGYSRHVRCVRN